MRTKTKAKMKRKTKERFKKYSSTLVITTKRTLIAKIASEKIATATVKATSCNVATFRREHWYSNGFCSEAIMIFN